MRLRQIIALNFVCEGPSLCAIVNFRVLEVFNSNQLSVKSCFIRKASENSFVRSSKRLTLSSLTSHPHNLCHNLKCVWCFFVFNLDGL